MGSLYVKISELTPIDTTNYSDLDDINLLIADSTDNINYKVSLYAIFSDIVDTICDDLESYIDENIVTYTTIEDYIEAIPDDELAQELYSIYTSTNIDEIADSISTYSSAVSEMNTSTKEVSSEVISYFTYYIVGGTYPYYCAKEITDDMYTWEELTELSDSLTDNSQDEFYNIKIGDYKYLTLGDYTFTMRVSGISTKYRVNSTSDSAIYYFLSDELYPEGCAWTSDSDNNGTTSVVIPYKKSNVYTILSNLYETYSSTAPFNGLQLPNQRIGERYSTSGVLTDDSGTDTIDFYLNVLSEYEIFGKSEYSNGTSAEYGRYPLFEFGTKYAVKCIYGTSTPAIWITRNVQSGSSTGIVVVDENGNAATANCTDTVYFPIAFAL